MFVKKTSLYIEPELDRALMRMAEHEGISKAELIRRTLRAGVMQTPRPRISAIGIGSGPGDVSADIDRHLAETDFGER
jgi:hypothetical protein